MADSIIGFLQKRFAAHGYAEQGGQTRLRNLLEKRYGIDVTPQAVSLWFKGDRSPALPALLALLDLLDVHGDERQHAIDLAGKFTGPISSDDCEAA